MITRDKFSETLRTKGVETYFEDSDYEHFPEQYKEITRPVKIDGAYEIKNSIIGVEKPQEREDGATTHESDMTEGYQVMRRSRFYDVKISITEGTKESVALDMVTEATNSWKEQYGDVKNEMVANLLNYGFYTAGHAVFDNSVPNAMADPSGKLCYDGKPFFNLTGNTRSSKGGGTYYNGETGVTLNSTNLAGAINSMTTRNCYNERDQKRVLRPKFLVTGPGSISQTAKQILDSELVPENANNAVNVMRGALKHIILDWITDTDFWAISCGKTGIWFYDSGAPKIFTWKDEDKGVYYYKISWGGACGVDQWRTWYGFNGSTS